MIQYVKSMEWQVIAWNGQQRPIPMRAILAPNVEAVTSTTCTTRAVATSTALPRIAAAAVGSVHFYIGKIIGH